MSRVSGRAWDRVVLTRCPPPEFYRGIVVPRGRPLTVSTELDPDRLGFRVLNSRTAGVWTECDHREEGDKSSKGEREVVAPTIADSVTRLPTPHCFSGSSVGTGVLRGRPCPNPRSRCASSGSHETRVPFSPSAYVLGVEPLSF